MAAFVLTPPDPPSSGPEAPRVDIFPGSATPAVFAARTPFWIGYGFTVEPDDADDPQRELSPGTTFELLVDGRSVPLATDSRAARGRIVARRCVATFDGGLSAGWHRFEGRWYDAGALVLTSDKTIEFVEP